MLERWRRAAAGARRRLGANVRQTLAFAAIGTLTERLTQAPDWFGRGLREGWDVFLPAFMHETISCAIAALVVSVAFRLCTEKGSDLVRRPSRFLLLLLLGTSTATVLVGAGGLAELAYFWLQTFLWGGLIGWLYLLSLQHTEDQAAFAGLLARRALLARQLARNSLGTARAQVDPAMVARVLNEVQRRYQTSPAAASTLLDHLISYVRLALNRGRSDKCALASEVAMIRALVALRGAEHQVAITLRVLVPDAAPQLRPGPLFQIASALLDEALGARPHAVQLELTTVDGVVGIGLTTGHVEIGAERTDALAVAVARILPAGRLGLQRIINSGGNHYVVRQVCQ